MSSEPDESDDGPKYDGPKFPGPNRWASGISERSSSSSGYLSGCSSRFSERNASLNSIGKLNRLIDYKIPSVHSVALFFRPTVSASPPQSDFESDDVVTGYIHKIFGHVAQKSATLLCPVTKCGNI